MCHSQSDDAHSQSDWPSFSLPAPAPAPVRERHKNIAGPKFVKNKNPCKPIHLLQPRDSGAAPLFIYFRATRGRTYLMLTWAHQDQRSSAGS